MFEYELNQLIPVADDVIKSKAMYSHNIRRVRLSDSSCTWICKEISDPAQARAEQLAQEFFRLIIPHQPETRIARDSNLNTYYLLSQEVEDYKLLPEGEPDNFLNGTYTGLGQAMLVAMFLEEIDLKNGNIGINAQNQVIKIDGDRCFAQTKNKYGQSEFDLTTYAIGFLPYACSFYAYNWLDLVCEGTKMQGSRIVCPTLARSEQFRAEVNQAILKINSIPDHFIECFVDSYLPAGGQVFIDLFKSRRNNLLQGALGNRSFVEYLETDVCQNDFLAMTEQMKRFSINNRSPLYLEDQHVRLDRDIAALRMLLKPAPIQSRSEKQPITKKVVTKPLTKPKKSIIAKALSFFDRGGKPKVANANEAKPVSPGLSKLKMAKQIKLRTRSSEGAIVPDTTVLKDESSEDRKEDSTSLNIVRK